MRLTAYKRAIDEAFELPEFNKSFKEYFHKPLPIRSTHVHMIMRRARLDVEGLGDYEFVKLREYMSAKEGLPPA